MELVSEARSRSPLPIQRKQGGVHRRNPRQPRLRRREEILLALAAKMGMEVVDLDEIEIDPVVINKVPTNLASPTTSFPSSSRTASSPSRCPTART